MNMNRRSTITGLVAAPFVASLPAYADNRTALKLAHHSPVSNHLHGVGEAMATHFNDNSDTHRIEVYGSGTLYTEKALVNSVAFGTVDLIFAASTFWEETVPEISLLDFPMLLNTYENAHAAIDGELGAGLKKIVEERNDVQLLSWMEFGINGMVINRSRRLDSIAAFEGLRIRAPNTYASLVMESVGASSVITSSSEVYLALQRGTMDGAFTGPKSVIERKFNEVTSFATHMPIQYSAQPVVVANRSWDRMGEPAQQLLMETVAMGQAMSRESSRADVEAGIEGAKQTLQMSELSPETLQQIADMAMPASEEYLQRVAGETGMQLLQTARAALT